MKQPYICCGCGRGADRLTPTCPAARCGGRLIDVRAWEADMLRYAQGLASRLNRSRIVVGRASR